MRQLVAWLGDEAFLAGLRDYFQRFAYRNATLADLIGTMAKAGGRDLTDWAELWLRRPEVNTLVPVVETDDGRYRSVHIEQRAPQRHPYLRPHRIAVGCYTATGAGTALESDTIEVACDPAVDGGRTPVPELVGRPAADLLLVNDGDLSFARVRFVPGAVDQLPTLLPALADPVSRTVVWSAAWDMLRSGELAPEQFVDLLVAALPAEPELAILEELLQLVRRFLTHRYLPAERRGPVLHRLTTLCRQLLDGAGDDQGRRLAAVRGIAAYAGTDEELALLRDWLAGAARPDGVQMDSELRWSVLERLIVLGVAGRSEIERELAADRSAAGESSAIRCRAALPESAAKDAAWTAMMTDRTLSNRHLEAYGRGFWRPEHAELTDGYVDRFFAEVPAVTRWRSPVMVMITAYAGYPSCAVRPATVDAAERLLATPDLDPVLRRGITDQDHEVRVALRARAVPLP